MTKFFPSIALSAIATATTIALSIYSYSSSASVTSEKPHLDNFLTLHTQYCEKKYDNQEMLKKTLEVAPELSIATEFAGVYEVNKNGISFAVSPEEDGCTTDVMIQTSDEYELFTFEDINTALIDYGYVETGEPVSRKDIGTDQSELTIIEKKYVSPKGEITVLDFPLEKKNKYYMTLFAEKFSETREQKRTLSSITLVRT